VISSPLEGKLNEISFFHTIDSPSKVAPLYPLSQTLFSLSGNAMVLCTDEATGAAGLTIFNRIPKGYF
jgi:hypothetical protein